MSKERVTFRMIGRLLISAVVATGTVFAAYFFLTSTIFRIRNVDIDLDQKANFSMTFPKIQENLAGRLSGLHGQFTWGVDLEKILANVEKDLRVKDAKVTRVLPNKIVVTVTPFTPIVNIMGSSSDRVYPVARDGEVLPPVATLEATDSPILRGQRFLQDKDLRMNALNMLLSLPETGPLSLARISEVVYNGKFGFQLTVNPDGSEVWLGSEDFAKHASQAARVLAYLQNEKLQGRVIDARYGKKVVVRLRNAP